jgi:hypothetical protein
MEHTAMLLNSSVSQSVQSEKLLSTEGGRTEAMAAADPSWWRSLPTTNRVCATSGGKIEGLQPSEGDPLRLRP